MNLRPWVREAGRHLITCCWLRSALLKFKQDPGRLVATASPLVERNDQKRLRVTGMRVQLCLGKPAAEIEHLDRVLAQFEDFCTVSMSVRQGIDISVQVLDAAGVQLKG